MLKLKILSVGKTKEKWLDEAIDEYIKRLMPFARIEFLWAKDDLQLAEAVRKEKHYICLDPGGILLTSEEFSAFFAEQWEKEGSRLTLIIGGPKGLPNELKQKGVLVSLSPLTFTHQMTRLILIEQIYRAIEIGRGSSYHKN